MKVYYPKGLLKQIKFVQYLISNLGLLVSTVSLPSFSGVILFGDLFDFYCRMEFALPIQLFLLERIANGKVEGKTFGKRVHVVESAAGCLVRRMKSDTEIEAEDEELHIIS